MDGRTEAGKKAAAARQENCQTGNRADEFFIARSLSGTALFLCARRVLAGRKCFRCIARFERKRSERVLISGPVPMLKRTTLAYGSGWRGRERRRR